jgi:hypothetical protein
VFNINQGEKVLALVGAFLFAATVIWALLFNESRDASKPLTGSELSHEFSGSLGAINGSSDSIDWGKPYSQGGPNWIFDIFTPPVIYYDEETRTFTVTPPFPNEESREDTFELELIEVVPQPYRFQLVSYAGSSGNYLLTLENLDTGTDVFCVPGETLSEHGLRISSFHEIRMVAESTQAGATEAFDLVGEALVEDVLTGKNYKLKHNKTTYLEKPLARFRTPFENSIALSVGETWVSGVANYLISSVDSSTNSATVEKTSSDVGDKVVKVLQRTGSIDAQDFSNLNSRQSEPQPGSF